MPAPTFVGAYPSTFNTNTTPRSTSAFDVAAGDVLAFGASDEAGAATDNYTYSNSGTALTWTEQTMATVSAGSYAFAQTATAPVSGAQTGITGTLTRVTGTAGNWFGGLVARFSNATVVGTAAARTTAADGTSPYSLAITTLLANSAIFYVLTDFAAVDFTGRTHLTVNGFTPSVGNGQELAYFRDSAHYGLCMAYIPDAGAAGAKTVGFSGVASGDFAIVAVEIGGTAAATPPIIVQPPRRH